MAYLNNRKVFMPIQVTTEGGQETGRNPLDLSAGTQANPVNISTIENGGYDVTTGGWIGSTSGQQLEITSGSILMIDAVSQFLTIITTNGAYVIYMSDTTTGWEDCYTPTMAEVSDLVSHDYSTNEKLIGTWIDGKPLYEKTIIFDWYNISGSSLTSGIAITDTLTNVDLLFIKNQYIYDKTATGFSNTSQKIIPMFENISSPILLYWDIASKQIKLYNAGAAFAKPDSENIRSFILIVQYTKTTD